MGNRKLEIGIISAEGLKDVRRLGHMRTYGVIWFDQRDKHTTDIDMLGGENPVWNEKFELSIPEDLFNDKNAPLTIEIYSTSLSHNKLVGSVSIPLNEMYEAGILKLYQPQYKTYEILRPSGRPQGKIHISYRLGDLTNNPSSMSTPPPKLSSSYSQTSPSPIPTKQEIWKDKENVAFSSTPNFSSIEKPIFAANAPISLQPQSSQFAPSPILKSNTNLKPPSSIKKRVKFAPLPTKSENTTLGDVSMKEDSIALTSTSPTKTPISPLSDVEVATNKLLINDGIMKKHEVNDNKEKNGVQAIDKRGQKRIDNTIQASVFAMPTSPLEEHNLRTYPNKDPFNAFPTNTNHNIKPINIFYNQRQGPQSKHELNAKTFYATKSSSELYGTLFHGNLGRMLLS